MKQIKKGSIIDNQRMKSKINHEQINTKKKKNKNSLKNSKKQEIK